MRFLRIILILFVSFINEFSYSQDMYRALMNQHDRYRYAFGLQITEPTAISFQLAKGYFCSGDYTYASTLIWELNIGRENMIFTDSRNYGNGKWKSGGIQSSLMAYYPLYTLPLPTLTLQTHFGAGIQGGSRRFSSNETKYSDEVLGGNLILRASVIGRAKELKNSIWFISYFTDLKYHKEFGSEFNYLKFGFGILCRKVR